ncbi:MAG TPA: heterodisulfide reductase-related iron-sulfur binding cluster, partial [Candidatus Binatia bacterium]|nr:heterodisulfide reductase-related iron-sulfur binding cluster [Candidatus Binatia bacterium]
IADPLRAEELEYALSNCLSCRACTTECPSNVNLSLLKAELLHARIKRTHLTSLQRLISSVDSIGRIGTKVPILANFLFDSRSVRHIFSKLFGLAYARPPLAFTRERFDHWFAKKHRNVMPPRRGSVILWDDTFVRYHEPHIGRAAVAVLEAAGFEVKLAGQRKCCGRPAFSVGNLDEAEKLGRHNLALLASGPENEPVIFLEPSCYSMFAEDYRELKLPDAAGIAARCFLFEDFVGQLLEREPNALAFRPEQERIVIHAHCHARALTDPKAMQRLAANLPGRTATLLDTGCCGMAGSFGMMESKYELSLEVAGPLIKLVTSQPYGTTVVVSGTSCRHQVQHLASVRTRHMAEVIADALA